MFRLSTPKGLVNGLSPAYAAALALICIQVGIGLVYKASQTGGKYGFSATASVTISEFLKFLLSSFFFWREFKRRGGAQSLSQDTPLHPPPAAYNDVEDGKERERHSEDLSLEEEDPLHGVDRSYSSPRSTFAAYMQAVREELPAETRYGFAHLALFYVLINNIVFVLFRLADPGTIQLIKSGTTLITALVMMFAIGTKIAGGQWIAICFQVCGIVVTQYQPGGGTIFPVSTYLILLFQTTLSAVSSVYNSQLAKSSDGSLHVMNMTLYGCGATINLILHVLVRIMHRSEPGFFTGYGNFGAVMVIISNVFIGLAMTAVYRYADALIKCFATAISTAVLLYLSPLLFNVNFSFLIVPGTFVVFLATWLYMDQTPKKPQGIAPPPEMKPAEIDGRQHKSFIHRLIYSLSPYGPFRKAGLGTTTSICFIVIGFVTYYRTHMIPTQTDAVAKPVAPVANVTAPLVPIVESPLKDVAAFIRINHDLPKRIETLHEGYAPFFHSIHYSMPGKDHTPNETYIDRDYLVDGFVPYPSMVDYLKLVLADPEYDEVKGVLFYHFDAWIAPLGFGDMDLDNLWVLDNPDAPAYMCQTEMKRNVDWIWFQQGWHEKAKQASSIVEKWYDGYNVDPKEFCAGWSDLYYIPRRFFQDFINLGGIFASVQVFHGIALPTIWNIIDRTYSSANPTLASSGLQQQALTRWTDCWGNCCKGGALPEDILEKRCGHHLDFLNWEITETHFARLKTDALLLGTEIEPTKQVIQTDKGPIFRSPAPRPLVNGTWDAVEDDENEAVHRFMMI